MDLFEKQGQDALLNGFDTIEKAVDSILIKRKPKYIEINQISPTYKIVVQKV